MRSTVCVFRMRATEVADRHFVSHLGGEQVSVLEGGVELAEENNN